LNNINLIRLPKNTTSVSQPLDAGVIMSFKVKYSRFMIPVISRYHHDQKTAKAHVPRGVLWACFPQAWNRVTLSCIRNCFAKVPVFRVAMQEYLKDAPKETTPDAELVQLRNELAELCPDRWQNIGEQTDYGILVFLRSMSRRGPTVYHDKFIDEIAANEKFMSFFALPDPVGGAEAADGEEGVDDDDLSDDEYLPPPTVPQEPSPTEQRTMNRRSGQYTSAFPPEEPSSQEPISSQEAPPQPTPATPTIAPLEDTLSPSSAKTKKKDSSLKTPAVPRIPADDMLTELRHYGTTHRK
jgi:hypothetical protein